MALLLGACGDVARAPAEVTPPAEGEAAWATLEEWHLFDDVASQTPHGRVFAYDVSSPLFSDETEKRRFMWIPKGAHIEYDAQHVWRFPVGTILVKTFAYPVDARDPEAGLQLLETRLLVRHASGWKPYAYVYDETGDHATRKVAGARIAVRWTDAEGEARQNAYAVPNENQCRECHGEEGRLDSLGGTTRQLNRQAPSGEGNQIDLLVERGWLQGAEPASARQALADPFGDAPLGERFRAYVDANCGHCHNDDPESNDDGSGLWLRYDLTDPELATRGSLGVCKMPQSAGGATCGRVYDVVPGAPDDSIMSCRIESEDDQVQMPPLGRNLADVRGIALIREWIASLDGACE